MPFSQNCEQHSLFCAHEFPSVLHVVESGVQVPLVHVPLQHCPLLEQAWLSLVHEGG